MSNDRNTSNTIVKLFLLYNYNTSYSHIVGFHRAIENNIVVVIIIMILKLSYRYHRRMYNYIYSLSFEVVWAWWGVARNATHER